MKNIFGRNILSLAKEKGTSAVNTKDFFGTYSKIAGKIKLIADLEGDEKDKAILALNKAIDGMKELKKLL